MLGSHDELLLKKMSFGVLLVILESVESSSSEVLVFARVCMCVCILGGGVTWLTNSRAVASCAGTGNSGERSERGMGGEGRGSVHGKRGARCVCVCE